MRKAMLVVGLGSVMAFAACGRYLQWKSAAPAATVVGKVAVQVEDQRQAKGIVKDLRVVGVAPGYMNIPTEIRLETPTEAAESLRDLFGQAALSAGVGVAALDDKAPSAVLKVNVGYLQCGGFWPVFIANFVGSVELRDPVTGAVRMPEQAINIKDGSSDCQSAHRNMLTKVYAEAHKLMMAQGFKDAAAASAAPAAAPAADAAPAAAPAASPAPAATPAK